MFSAMWPSELRYKPMFDEHLQPRLHVYPKSGRMSQNRHWYGRQDMLWKFGRILSFICENLDSKTCSQNWLSNYLILNLSRKVSARLDHKFIHSFVRSIWILLLIHFGVLVQLKYAFSDFGTFARHLWVNPRIRQGCCAPLMLLWCSSDGLISQACDADGWFFGQRWQTSWCTLTTMH